MKLKPGHWLAAGVVVVAAAFAAGRSGWLEPFKQLARSRAELPPGTEVSIAILPFAVTGPDENSQYLSEALPQELIASLSSLEKLKVIGRVSSFKFKDPKIDAKSIGAKLGIRYLLEGSMNLSGSQLQVSVQLMSVADGSRLWLQSYDHPLNDLAVTESEIANAVAREIGVDGIGNNARILQTPLQSLPANGEPEPYLALLQGDFHAARDTEAELRRAIAFYEEAIRFDRSYAMAQARLSLALSTLSTEWLSGAEIATANARALSAAQTAVRLTPDLSEAHEAVANVDSVAAFDQGGTGTELRKALELAPADGELMERLGEWLVARGETQEGLALLKEALNVDPLNTHAYLRTGMALSGLGHYDEAEVIARKALDLDPSAVRLHLLLTELALVRGRTDAALDEARREADPFWHEFALALVAQQQGGAAADAALTAYNARHSLSDASQIAVLYALRKDPDHMFAWLNRGITERDSGVFWWLLSEPFLMVYKNDPRFGSLCVRLGIDPSVLHG